MHFKSACNMLIRTWKIRPGAASSFARVAFLFRLFYSVYTSLNASQVTVKHTVKHMRLCPSSLIFILPCLLVLETVFLLSASPRKNTADLRSDKWKLGWTSGDAEGTNGCKNVVLIALTAWLSLKKMFSKEQSCCRVRSHGFGRNLRENPQWKSIQRQKSLTLTLTLLT